jgi:N-methylhydantoinase A
MPAAAASPQRLRAAAAPLDLDCARRMQLDSVPASTARVEYFAEMRYVGQAHELEVSLGHALDEAVLARAVDGFHRAHEQTYSHCDRASATEFVTLRTVHTADSADTSLLRVGQQPTGPAPSPRRRRICLDARTGFEEVDVWSRSELPVGFAFTGPAIVEQADTTTLVYPGHRATVDAIGNILIDVPLPE